MERRIINPWTWQEQFGFVHANELSSAQRTLVCSGQLATDADGNLMHAGDLRGQIELVLDNIEKVLREAGFQLSDIVQLHYYTTDVDGFIAAGDILGNRLGAAGCKPSATLLGISQLAFPDAMIEIEAVAVA